MNYELLFNTPYILLIEEYNKHKVWWDRLYLHSWKFAQLIFCQELRTESRLKKANKEEEKQPPDPSG